MKMKIVLLAVSLPVTAFAGADTITVSPPQGPAITAFKPAEKSTIAVYSRGHTVGSQFQEQPQTQQRLMSVGNGIAVTVEVPNP